MLSIGTRELKNVLRLIRTCELSCLVRKNVSCIKFMYCV